MFSSSEYQYIKDLTLQLYNQGYISYVCITNNPISNYNSYNVYDVICYYSKDNITNNDNVFTFNSSDKLKCSLDSNNYSENNTIDKLICSSFDDTTIIASKKEFIYSNVGTYSNIISDYENNVSNYLDLNFMYMIPILLIIIILNDILHHIFYRK